MGTEAQLDVLDRLIDWRFGGDPRYPNPEEPNMSQRQWTIEIRADFADKEKNDAISKIVKEVAVYLHANTALLSDVQKPDVACYSDDFFHGRKELDLHNDKIGNAIAAHGDQIGGGGGVSNELLQAAADMEHERTVKK